MGLVVYYNWLEHIVELGNSLSVRLTLLRIQNSFGVKWDDAYKAM